MKKRNKVLIITSVIFAIVAVTALIAGYAISGADVIGWFSSKWAMMTYTFVGIYALFVTFVFVSDWIRRM